MHSTYPVSFLRIPQRATQTCKGLFTLAAALTAMLTGTQATAASGECERNRDCRSRDWDTLSWCYQGECLSTDRLDPDCAVPTTRVCWWDRHCNDGNPDTVNWCEWDWWTWNGGTCYAAPIDGSACEPAPQPECTRNRDCRDGDRSTRNWCYEGQCYEVDRSDANCKEEGSRCWRTRDCRDGDRNTVDWCYQGTCHHAPKDKEGVCAPPIQTITVNPDDVGYYLHASEVDTGNSVQSYHFESPSKEHKSHPIGNRYVDNFILGTGNIETRAYFVFNVGQVTGALSAKLRWWVWQPSSANNLTGAYSSDDPSETVGLFSVDTPANEVISAPFNDNFVHEVDVAIWKDLGQGQSYGTRVFTPDDGRTDLVPGPNADQSIVCNPEVPNPCGKWVEFELSAQAIEAINAAQGQWAIGAALTTINAPETTREWTNNGSILDLNPEKESLYPQYLPPAPELVIEAQQ